MRIGWICFILALLLSSAVHAQEEAPDYRLRVPDVGAYLELITLLPVPQGDWEMWRLFDLMERELQFLDDNLSDQPSHRIIEAYNTIVNASGIDFRPFYKDYWNRAIVLQWLSENDIDLSDMSDLSFTDYQIEIIPRDFDADGENEYLLHVKRKSIYERLNYEDYLVIHQLTAGHYEIIPSPLPWLGEFPAYYADQSGTIEEFLFEDINHDGLPEWVLEHNAANTGMGSGDRRKLFILAWRDNELVNLTPTEGEELLDSNNEYTTSTWEITNADEDPESEIIKHRALADNWGCGFTQQAIFNWDAAVDGYVFTGNKFTYNDSAGCAWRNAEEGMWRGDYLAAIPHYLAFLDKQQVDYDDAAADRQYVQFRLAIAYAMTDQTEAAQAIINALTEVKPFNTDLDQLITEIREAYTTQDKNSLCTAAFNFFTRYRLLENYTYRGPVPRPLGETYVDIEMFFMNTSPADPAKAGCDIRRVIDHVLEEPFSLQVSPNEQLESFGIQVAQSFHFDFDADGRDEWIIWPEVLTDAILFVPDGDYYSPSRFKSSYYYPLPWLAATQQLPDSEINALVTMTYYPDWGEGAFIPGTCSGNEMLPIGHIDLWVFESGGFNELIGGALCERLALNDIIQDNGRNLHVWSSMREAYVYDPIVLTWSPETQDFELTSVSGEPYIPENFSHMPPDYTEQPRPISEMLGLSIYFFPDNLDRLAEVVAELEISLTDAANSKEALEGRYFRALALEALNRPDEALAEYIAIYEAAPESAWGQLAALHLEPVAP